MPCRALQNVALGRATKSEREAEGRVVNPDGSRRRRVIEGPLARNHADGRSSGSFSSFINALVSVRLARSSLKERERDMLLRMYMCACVHACVHSHPTVALRGRCVGVDRALCRSCRCVYMSRTNVCTSGVSRSTWVVRRRRDRTQRPAPHQKNRAVSHSGNRSNGPRTLHERGSYGRADRHLCVRAKGDRGRRLEYLSI